MEYLVISNKVKENFVTYFCSFIRPKDRSAIDEFEKVNKQRNSDVGANAPPQVR